MRLINPRLSFVVAAVFAAGLWASTASAVTIIDHFDSPPNPGAQFDLDTLVNPSPLSQTWTELGLLSVLGQQRQVTLDLASGAGAMNVSINVYAPTSTAQLMSGPSVQPFYTVLYNAGSQLNANLSASDQFNIKMLYADQAGAKIVVTVESHIGEINHQVASVASAPLPAISIGGSYIQTVTFAQLLAANPNLDFSDVDSLKFRFEGPQSFDGIVDYFQASTIPLPASAWAGGALMCLLAVAKVRRMARA